MTDFAARIIGASALRPHIYEDVEADRASLGQALIVVVLSSLAGAIGAFRESTFELVAGTLAGLLAWLFWAWLTYMIGTRMFPAPETRTDL